MTKKNGFTMYLDSRRPELVAQGHSGEIRDLVALCSPGWKDLPEVERRKFVEQAKDYNERLKLEKARKAEAKSKNPPRGEPQKKTTDNPYQITPEDTFHLEDGRNIVSRIFDPRTILWKDQPVVICSFSLYVEPGFDLLFMPAEIGLTAMSLTDGLLDNFARIIDPGSVPKGYGIEALHTTESLGLPRIGTIPEFLDLDSVMTKSECFLQKHKGEFKGEELYVFCFDTDYRMVSRCWDWLFEYSKIRFPLKVLSLDTYAYMASQNSPTATQLKESGGGQCSKVSSYRTPGISLSGHFIYAAKIPNCAYGIFTKAEEVEKCVRDVDNYKYYEELCCVFHLKRGKEIHKCALSISNRYAFSLLEILTLSHEIPVVGGKHFPELDHPDREKKRRYRMLHSWGLTQFEEKMEYVTDFPEAVDLRQGPRFSRGWPAQSQLPEIAEQDAEEHLEELRPFRGSRADVRRRREDRDDRPISRSRSDDGTGRSWPESKEPRGSYFPQDHGEKSEPSAGGSIHRGDSVGEQWTRERFKGQGGGFGLPQLREVSETFSPQRKLTSLPYGATRKPITGGDSEPRGWKGEDRMPMMRRSEQGWVKPEDRHVGRATYRPKEGGSTSDTMPDEFESDTPAPAPPEPRYRYGQDDTSRRGGDDEGPNHPFTGPVPSFHRGV